MTSARELLRKDAAYQRQQLHQACCRILQGDDTPGRRWLLRYLRDDQIDPPPNGLPERLGMSTDRFLLPALRLLQRLRSEFPALLDEGD